MRGGGWRCGAPPGAPDGGSADDTPRPRRRDYCGRVKLSSGLPAGVVFIATASDMSRW
jgi:hypothetical protein